MPISAAEAGLSEPVYDALMAQNGNPVYRVTAYQYNLAFSLINTTVVAETPAWDMCEMGDKVYRVAFNGNVDIFDPATSILTSWGMPVPTGAIPSISLVTDGSTLYFFWATTTGIQLTTSADGITWSGFTNIFPLVSANYLIAAGSPTEVHFYIWDVAKTNFQFATTTNSGGGFSSIASDSGITWTTRPHAMSAIRYNGSTIIAISADQPGNISAKYINNKVVKYVYRQAGVMCFKYTNGTWSDHIDMEVFNNASGFLSRENVKLSVVGSKLVSITTSIDGTQEFQFVRLRYQTSKDAIYWSASHPLEITGTDVNDSMKWIRPSGSDNVFAFTSNQIYSAPSTIAFDHAAPSTILDITPYIKDYQASQSPTFTSGIQGLSNLDGTFIANPNNITALKHEWGYWLADFNEPVLVQVALEQVDVYETDTQIDASGNYEKYWKLVSRDRNSWMTDYVASEQATYWQSQGCFGDSYFDITTTDYGGLQHSAIEQGSWKTHDNQIYLATSNTPGVVFSAFQTDLWNGAQQVGFKLSTASNGEYAGVCFRAQDYHNMWYVIYDQTTDKILLYERRADVDTNRGIGATLGWTTLQYYYIRVEFNYARIVIYTSTDSWHWTYYNGYVMDGVESLAVGGLFDLPLTQIPYERGFVGLIAKGFSSEDVIPSDPGPVDIPLSYPAIRGPRPPEDSYVPTSILLLLNDASIQWVTGISGGGGALVTQVKPPSGSAYVSTIVTATFDMISDPRHPKRLIVLQGTDIYICPDFTIVSPVWTHIDVSAFGATCGKIAGSINRDGWFAWLTYDNAATPPNRYIVYTADNFLTFHRVKYNAAEAGDVSPFPADNENFEDNLAVGVFNGSTPSSTGVLYISSNNGRSGWFWRSGNARIYKSVDWGVTWTQYDISQQGSGGVVHPFFGNIEIPYSTTTGDNNVTQTPFYGFAGDTGVTDYVYGTGFTGYRINSKNLDSSIGALLFGGGDDGILQIVRQRGFNSFTLNSSTMYYVGSANPFSNQIYFAKTVDGGATWTPLTLSGTIVISHSNEGILSLNGWPTNPNYIIAAGGPGCIVQYSVDGGTTWIDLHLYLNGAGITQGVQVAMADFSVIDTTWMGG